MGSSLGSVLANITMTELELKIINPLIDSGKTTFYTRFVDDRLLLAKEEDINSIFKKFNSFHPSLQFTIDRFDNDKVNFLDISIDKNKTDLYYKPTHTGQYSDISSNTPWNYKTAWIKALYHRAKKVCTTKDQVNRQVDQIELFMSWNGYPSYVRNTFIKRLKNKNNKNNNELDERKIIWIRLPYLGEREDQMKRNCFRKVKQYLKEEVIFNFQNTLYHQKVVNVLFL